MAKAKKTVKTVEENNVEPVNSPSKQKPPKSPTKGQKPATKPAKRGFKSRVNNPPMGEMVTAALKALKNENGVALISIRKYILANYDGYHGKIGKATQTDVKNALADAFQSGKIIMTNDKGDAIKFNMRFNMVAE